MASDLYNTIDALSREKGIDPQIVVSAVEDAMVIATRKSLKSQENMRAELDKAFHVSEPIRVRIIKIDLTERKIGLSTRDVQPVAEGEHHEAGPAEAPAEPAKEGA